MFSGRMNTSADGKPAHKHTLHNHLFEKIQTTTLSLLAAIFPSRFRSHSLSRQSNRMSNYFLLLFFVWPLFRNFSPSVGIWLPEREQNSFQEPRSVSRTVDGDTHRTGETCEQFSLIRTALLPKKETNRFQVNSNLILWKWLGNEPHVPDTNESCDKL